jgi:hypothetical protein
MSIVILSEAKNLQSFRLKLTREIDRDVSQPSHEATARQALRST